MKAKKTLETNADDESNRSELPDMDSTRISDELDGLTRSLTSQQAIPKAVQVGRPNSSNPFSEKVTAPKQILPFENLIDFRKAITRCQLPLVTSFLSDDEPSKEVENALRHLVAKHHTRAAFIAVHSKSEDIARECKIRSYPTILVFRDGKTLGELKLTNCEQLEKDLVEVIERAASDDHREVTPTESISQTMLAEKSPQTNRLVNKVMGQARERCKTCNE